MTTSQRMIAVALALLIGASLTGCANPEQPVPQCKAFESGVVFIVGAHANQPAPNLTADLACRLEQTIRVGGAVAVIANDGLPHAELPATVFDVDGNTPATVKNQVLAGYNAVVATVQNAKPTSDGSDFYASLVLAADVARTAYPAITTIVGLDSGLPDTGSVDMTITGMTTVAPADLSAYLMEEGELDPATFAGLTVEFWGIGYTAAPQDPISQAQTTTVGAAWVGIVTAGGGAASLTPYPWSGPGVTSPFSTETVEVIDPMPFEPHAGDIIVLDESVLSFLGDSPDFLNDELAKATLAPIAEWLMAAPSRSAVVLGYASSARLSIADELSAGRALTTEAGLIALGVDEGQITTEGMGYAANPPDRRADGSLDPVAASMNRVVTITLSEG